jgi:hypothetical protein
MTGHTPWPAVKAHQQLIELIELLLPDSEGLITKDDRTRAATVVLDALLSDEGRPLLQELLFGFDDGWKPIDAEVLVAGLKERGVLVPHASTAYGRIMIVRPDFLPGGES